MEKNEMRGNILHNLKEIDILTNKTEELIAGYIKEHHNGRIDFTDKTGYPHFEDNSDQFLQNVLAVKVEDGEIYFNTDTDLSEGYYESEKVDENCWFRPRDYGVFDLNDLCEVVLNV